MTSCSTNSTTQYPKNGSVDESVNTDINVEDVSEEYKIKLLNSVGNTLNKNLVDEDSDWIYYSTTEDQGIGTGGLYRKSKKDGELYKLVDKGVLDFSVEDNYIYYRVMIQEFDDSYMFDSNDCILYKFDLDTMTTSKLFEIDIFDALYTDKYIIGTTGQNRYLVKVGYASGEYTLLNNGFTDDVFINNNWVYFTDLEGESTIVKVRINGDDYREIKKSQSIEDSCYLSYVDDDFIYYIHEEKLKRSDLGGENSSIIYNDLISAINIYMDKLYILDYDMKLYVMDKEGSNKEVLLELTELILGDSYDLIDMSIVDNQIFIYSYMKNKIYVIDIDNPHLVEIN